MMPNMYPEKAFCEPITDMLTDVPNEATVYWNEKAYKSCNLDYGSICPNRRCRYAMLNVKNGETIQFTCGRGKDESKVITLQDCIDLHKKFIAFADRAEQHSFLELFQIDVMIEHSIKKWEAEGMVNQGEAKTMFRVVNKFMEGEY